MSDDNATREKTAVKLASCLGWLAVFGLLGTLAIVPVTTMRARWIDQDELQRSHALMSQQIEQIKKGEINGLIDPDPRFIHELLADRTCAAKIRELDVGGDLSDERLGRLRELPNLKSIAFLFADNPDALLERLQGMATIEELTFERTFPSRRGIELINTFPKLQSLCLPLGGDVSDLQGIENNPSIENLVLTQVGCDDRLLPLLQSLPRLRTLTIGGAEENAELFEDLLSKALPNCRCRVEYGC